MSLAAEIRAAPARSDPALLGSAASGHYRASEIELEACFQRENWTKRAGAPPLEDSLCIALRQRPSVLVVLVDISAQFERRMAALLPMIRNTASSRKRRIFFPQQQEIQERLGAIAGQQPDPVKYGEPFVVKETMRVDDIPTMGVRSL